MAHTDSNTGDDDAILRTNNSEPILIEDDEIPSAAAKKGRALPPEWFQPRPCRPSRVPPQRPVQTVFVGRLPAVQPSPPPKKKKRKQAVEKEGAKRIRKSATESSGKRDLAHQRTLENRKTVAIAQEVEASSKASKRSMSSDHEEGRLAEEQDSSGWHGIDQQACQLRYTIAKAARDSEVGLHRAKKWRLTDGLWI